VDIPDGVNQLLCSEAQALFDEAMADRPEDVIVIWYHGNTMSCNSTEMPLERFIYMCEAAKAAALVED
jgi:hypothetical protein